MSTVAEYLSKHEQVFIENLCQYVRFPSVSAQSDHVSDMQACAQWISNHCKSIGLISEICTTEGNPIVLAKTPGKRSSNKPHFLVYGHYDVQPTDPLDLWVSAPFEPRIEGRNLFARGATDNKGQHMAHLNAVEAYLKTGTELPVDLTFLLEGEEEIGSKNLATFLRSKQQDLACDAVIISDTGMPGKNLPALTYALRGITAIGITIQGPSRDLHSGIYGGSLENPAMALCQLLAQLRDKNGHIAIPGFYDDVIPLSKYERKQLARLPFSEKAYAKFLGVPALFGEKGYTPWEQRTSRPTLEINGLTSGYQGEGSKTIVPAWAHAKLTFRLVAKQNPVKIAKLVKQHLLKICPKTVKINVNCGHGGEPYWMDPQGQLAQTALKTLKNAFGDDPVLLREGGSIPIVNDFKKILKAETLLLGLSLPDDNAHSPNEKFDLDIYAKGALMSAMLWPDLASTLLKQI